MSGVSSSKQRFARQWIVSKQNEWTLLPLQSSLDAAMECVCCGKGKSNGRPLALINFVTPWAVDMIQPKWVCLFCAAGVLHCDDDIIQCLRKRYRRQFNDDHLGDLTDQLLPLAGGNSIAAEYMTYVNNDKSIPPSLLMRARKLVLGHNP